MKRIAVLLGAAFLVTSLFGCTGGGGDKKDKEGSAKLKGKIEIDGSSTVFLITEAVAKTFNNEHPEVKINIGISGTGGGFKKFCNGELDIADASRPITANEIEKCKAKNINYLELQVGWDGLAVIINKENTFAAKMTVAQLKKIWQADNP